MPRRAVRCSGLRCRYGHYHIAGKHDGQTCDHTLGEAPFVSHPAAYQRHEIDKGEEARVDLARHGGVKAEFGLQEEQEDGKHGVVAETFAGVGEREHIEACRLVFEHGDFCKISERTAVRGPLRGENSVIIEHQLFMLW